VRKEALAEVGNVVLPGGVELDEGGGEGRKRGVLKGDLIGESGCLVGATP
jgi:hypothetical protein